MQNDVTQIQIPVASYMLLWFTNPNKIGNEQGLCSQFYNSLDEAEKSAVMLSGSRISLMCTAQNVSPTRNVYWNVVKVYGNSFELNELTIMSEGMQQNFLVREGKN
jgi:hypothetical protein